MIRCTMRATSRPPAAMEYAFYDEGGLKILHNRDHAFADQFDYLFRELPLIPYTLSLIDADENERFRLERKTPAPFHTHAFRLSFDGETVDFFDDKTRFSLPNLSFFYRKKKYDIDGFIRSREFFIEENEEKIMAMTASPVVGGKEYAITVYKDALPLAVSFASAIILDICFHNY
ncbi:MAG: hypothetical protein SOW18_01275 [Peptoniphilus sp.]|nr:hypothetical protein [Peptoniphilus sp.]MDY3118152.1 hypothetical protein [Peptoniphilus sp.]